MRTASKMLADVATSAAASDAQGGKQHNWQQSDQRCQTIFAAQCCSNGLDLRPGKLGIAIPRADQGK